MHQDYDVIVIGGGHAGIEAAAASARIGAKTLMLTIALDSIGAMSCNPAIGGVAKGQLVREIDALGGVMGHLIDATGIHFRMLNTSKGPAVTSPRAQADKDNYRRHAKLAMERTPNLSLLQAEVTGLTIEMLAGKQSLDRELRGADGVYRHPAPEPVFRITGVHTSFGLQIRAPRVVVTTGTFLRGAMHQGEAISAGGRAGERATHELATSLAAIGLRTGRLKTGTPPRLAGRSIDFSGLERQDGDATPSPFSFATTRIPGPFVPCWITRTSAATHAIVTSERHRSPVYSGAISGKGPRYCPSIEDKIVKFPDRTSHQVFLEPEGLHTDEYYANGISTSLPFEVQDRLVASVPGLEHARITRYGYAVEYDYVPPHQLARSLECRNVAGLYFAGQINGTTGYEEAAAQGLIAGANAALSLSGREAWVPGREQAYIGVLVDDLTTRSTDEPYRMFTSLAEHRLRLRQDNADRRLTPLAARLGLVSQMRGEAVKAKEQRIAEACDRLDQVYDDAGRSWLDWLRRPEASVAGLLDRAPWLAELTPDERTQVEIDAKYRGYLERQDRDVAKLQQLESVRIPADVAYLEIDALRKEAREKFTRFQPQTLGQASRIAGIGPSDIGVLEVFLRARRDRRLHRSTHRAEESQA